MKANFAKQKWLPIGHFKIDESFFKWSLTLLLDLVGHQIWSQLVNSSLRTRPRHRVQTHMKVYFPEQNGRQSAILNQIKIFGTWASLAYLRLFEYQVSSELVKPSLRSSCRRTDGRTAGMTDAMQSYIARNGG